MVLSFPKKLKAIHRNCANGMHQKISTKKSYELPKKQKTVKYVEVNKQFKQTHQPE